MSYTNNSCHTGKTKRKERKLLLGFIISVATVIWHLFHCVLPIAMPLLVMLNISMPPFIHHLRIPPIFAWISMLWIIYYLLRKRVHILWLKPGFKRRPSIHRVL
ncbi:MAG: hypothetical protein FIA99_14985 [Ruminiclostridium sp.]|nr:hypothetical protein [Ruminiclostridium sp.]